MNIGTLSPPSGDRGRWASGVLAGAALATAALTGMMLGLGLLRPVYAVDPGARGAIETAITLSAILTAGLLVASLEHGRRLVDLSLLCALAGVAITDFVYCAVPVLVGASGWDSQGGAWSASGLIVALALAAAAFAPRITTPGRARGLNAVALGAGAGTVALAALLAQVTGPHGGAHSLASAGMTGAAEHPVALALTLVSAALLIGSAVALLGRREGREHGSGLLAGASFLLAAARLQYLVMPAVGIDWITPREGLRLGAYSLLLAAAALRYAARRRSRTHAAITAERERIARDLHDGLAQDLACIAVQGQRLDTQLAAEHPLMVATRNALAASRGAIADLTASAAPSTEAALRLVADDLERRYSVNVGVRVETDSTHTVDSHLEPTQREHLVRIAREAIVNAALHGTAHHVDVVLLKKGRELLMRVSDDGCGITDADRSGFGLRTMRARAASLGAQLSARPGQDGGTELELLVS
jgi:signal transduction histidine kinase